MHVIYASDFYVDLERWLIYIAVRYRNLAACQQLRRDIVNQAGRLCKHRSTSHRQRIPSESGNPLYAISVAKGYFQMIYSYDKPSRSITVLRLLHCE